MRQLSPLAETPLRSTVNRCLAAAANQHANIEADQGGSRWIKVDLDQGGSNWTDAGGNWKVSAPTVSEAVRPGMASAVHVKCNAAWLMQAQSNKQQSNKQLHLQWHSENVPTRICCMLRRTDIVAISML
jgi:hypothetical protein